MDKARDIFGAMHKKQSEELDPVEQQKKLQLDADVTEMDHLLKGWAGDMRDDMLQDIKEAYVGAKAGKQDAVDALRAKYPPLTCLKTLDRIAAARKS